MINQENVPPSTTEGHNDTLWNAGDVAVFLRVSRSSVRRYVEKEGLPFIPLPAGARFDPDAVRQWVKDREMVKDDEAA
jgi:hypothetical protein